MQVDTVIVGSGTSGLSALREVRRHTDDFLLINDGHWGTTCAAVGCMPSKALIEAANAFHRRKAFEAFGIRGGESLRIDVPAVLRRVRALRDDFVAGPVSMRDELGERAIAGHARLDGPGRLSVNGESIEARTIILAPGSRPVVPEPWKVFGDRLLTTDTLFERPDLPRRVAVVGMGAVGAELAQALARLNIEVTGFDAADKLAGIDDPAVLDAFRAKLACEMDIQLGAAAELEAADDAIRVTGAGDSVEVDAVLAALGRRPNIEGLGLESLGVDLDDRGMPAIDPTTLRIGDLDVFLAGDANGYRPLLHEAADEGYIAGRMAAPDSAHRSYRRRTPLSIVFSSPQVARVGPALSSMDASRLISAAADFSRQARARMAEEAAGVLRIHAERDSGILVGAELCAPAAEHLAHLLALAIERELTVSDMLAMPFYHPVLEEGLRGALRKLARELPVDRGSDLSACGDIGQEALD